MSVKAKESAQIQKARKKIKNQLATADKRINIEALHEMSKLIRQQIARHANERVNLKSKLVTLFDENQHSAHTQSKFINRLLTQLKHKTPKEKDLRVLEGRIRVQK